jgi:hypothetical protein
MRAMFHASRAPPRIARRCVEAHSCRGGGPDYMHGSCRLMYDVTKTVEKQHETEITQQLASLSAMTYLLSVWCRAPPSFVQAVERT